MQFCASELYPQIILQASGGAFSLPTAREILGDEKIKTDDFIKYIGLQLYFNSWQVIICDIADVDPIDSKETTDPVFF